MRSRILKKILSVSICLILFFAMPIQSFAQEAEEYSVTPRLKYIMFYTQSITVSNGTANIDASLEAISNSSSCSIKCNLEKLVGTYWLQLDSFWANGTGHASLNEDYSVSYGTYRVHAFHTCETETQSAYTSNVTYQSP